MTTTEVQSRSEALLQEIKKRQRAKEVVDVEVERVKVLIFGSGEGSYAFRGVEVREILSAHEISWVPGLPEYLPGLINVRGDIEPVVDISHFLGETKARGPGLIAIAVKGGFHTGVIIDRVEDVVDVEKSSIGPPLATLNGRARELVVGDISFGGRTIPLLDVARLAALVTL